ncbi:MAG: GNVR domain-containing protein [Candidatus Zixiibacteriota bacterium]
MQNRKITLKNAALRDEADGDQEKGQHPISDINLIETARLLYSRRKFLSGCVLSVMIVTAIVVLLLPNQYRSTASILPSGKVDKMAQLKSLADLDAFMTQDENSSEMFPTILTSRTVMDAVLAGEYSFIHDEKVKSLTLAEYFDQDNPERLRQALAEISTFDMDKKTGVIGLSVETKYPRLSKAILSRYLEELESFNMHKRRSQAKDNARFLEREVADRDQQLRKAEEKLQDYQTVNRDWEMTSDPEILKNLMQLKRDVEVKSKTYILVLEQYELARLDAQKDVPIVRILDNPSVPTLKSGPRRMITTFLAGFLTFFLAAFWIIASDSAAKKGYKTEIDIKLPAVIRRRFGLMEEINA